MTSPPSLPTFCHISEYGQLGYRDLHRMLAMSRPLNLWAPSSAELLSPHCRIAPAQFVKYVRTGAIRVHARQKWLTDVAYRNEHQYPGARWNEEIDGELLDVYQEDIGKQNADKRVVAALEETGPARAREYLDQHEDQVRRWNKIFKSRSAEEILPIGILEAAHKHAKTPRQIAEAILRDAFSHGEAYAQSGAQVPFLLGSADRKVPGIDQREQYHR